MASILPRPAMATPLSGPPTSALPPLPPSKTRKSITRNLQLSEKRQPPPSQLPSRLASRTSSRSAIPSASAPKAQHATSTTSIPTLRTLSSDSTKDFNPPEKKLRKTISIASFPQPPRTSRIGTLGGRPSLGGSLSSASPTESMFGRDLGDATFASTPRGSVRIKKLRLSTEPTTIAQSYISSQSPSLLNGSGDDKCVSTGPSQRTSDGLLSVPSPMQSRSSSVQGSYSTSATTFEDVEDSSRKGKEDMEEAVIPRRSKAKDAKEVKEGKGNVIVSVRVRPNSNDEETKISDWLIDGGKSLVAYRGRERGDYFYDNVFGTSDENQKVYESSAKRLVRRVMEGYHGTVFAYGMTGTGKTFSMQGTRDSPGVIPLAVSDIFSYIRETPDREFLLRVSYLEIYNEKIHDLLSATLELGPHSSPQEEIKLREDPKRGVYATPLKEEIVQSFNQLMRVIARGDNARRSASTQYNTHSSRSHAVVQIVVESRERTLVSGNAAENKRAALAPTGVRVSTLSLIDLAGSERAAESKDRRAEGAHINKSLLTLGTVIARLSGDKDKAGNPTDKDGKHLPYRDSKLTRLLQSALSGNALISILCTIQIGAKAGATTAHNHTAETLNTLKFAARAKNNIVSHAKRAEEDLGNGVDPGSRALLERYRMEIQTLRTQLDEQVRVQALKEEKQLEKEAEHRHEEQMLEMQLARTALKERIEHLNRLILCSKSTGVNINGSLSPSVSLHPRLAAYRKSSETGTQSIRSSTSHSTLQRTVSGASTTIGIQNIQISTVQSSTPTYATGVSPTGEDDETMGEFADGVASLQAQNYALQMDLVDKKRYIETLEKRLLQARRSSNPRSSLSSSVSPTSAIQERDAEIKGLKEQLNEKEKTIKALKESMQKSNDSSLNQTSKRMSATLKAASPTKFSHHQANLSNSSSVYTSGSGTGAFSPVELLASPGKTNETETSIMSPRKQRTKSRDEMHRMLNEMIEERVRKSGGRRHSGQLPTLEIGGLGVSALAVAGKTPSPTKASFPGGIIPEGETEVEA